MNKLDSKQFSHLSICRYLQGGSCRFWEHEVLHESEHPAMHNVSSMMTSGCRFECVELLCDYTKRDTIHKKMFIFWYKHNFLEFRSEFCSWFILLKSPVTHLSTTRIPCHRCLAPNRFACDAYSTLQRVQFYLPRQPSSLFCYTSIRCSHYHLTFDTGTRQKSFYLPTVRFVVAKLAFFARK